jgi:hypothetical protein
MIFEIRKPAKDLRRAMEVPARRTGTADHRMNI